MVRRPLRPDSFTLTLAGVVAAASLVPCEGPVAGVFDRVTHFAIAALFFLHGARLSRAALWAGATHWRLHGVIFSTTFILFPLLGLALWPLVGRFLSPGLYHGILFLCALPATVQSAIAFTSLARGNIPAAVCSASASSLIGIVVTPVLVGLLLPAQSSRSTEPWIAIRAIVVQLLVPFLVGQVSRPLIARWVDAHKKLLSLVDRGSILLVVYTAFSAAVIQGLWRQLKPTDLVLVLIACALLLGAALGFTLFFGRRLGFTQEDEIALVFCGSKKSLATGIPMAQVMFSSTAVGPIVLPLMIFHQLQLMVCAILAQRYANRADISSVPAPLSPPRD